MNAMRVAQSVAAVALVVSALEGARAHDAALARGSPRLVDEVRTATQRFHDVAVAKAAGYASMGSCVSGPQEGAMGVHYVNGALVGDGVLDPGRPEALLYEPSGGRLKLVGVEFIVLAAQWDATNAAPPILLGQHFHHVGSPNRYGLPPFYELHVWAWKDNRNGAFVDWHPGVSCDAYSGEDAGGHAPHR